MRLIPKGKMIVGRVVDIDTSKGGLVLATSQVRNVTVFMLVDAVGPDVKQCKVGDIVLYKSASHVFTRDGTHFLIGNDDDILTEVLDLVPEMITFEGETPDQKTERVARARRDEAQGATA